jgi:hypothetical protein
MTMNKVYEKVEKVLSAWAKEYRLSLAPEVRKAINLATHDLWYSAPSDGSTSDPPTDEYGNENEWSGYSFDGACKMIKDALNDLPSTLYIDTDCEDYFTSMPENEECPECDGNGYPCHNCNGSGTLEPMWDHIYQVEKSDLKKAILGKDLADCV